MKRILILLALAIVFGGGWFFMFKERVKEPPADENKPISSEIDTQIRARVVEFGSKLKNVSLLMPPQDLKTQMQTHYGPYLTKDLLTLWQNDPAKALGRSVSSPWPDRIEVVEVTRLNDESYKAEGNVIEITSADTPLQPAAIYPVTLVLKKDQNTWYIASIERGAYSEMPKRVTKKGFWECLPHKDTKGPQTLECAFGIAIDQSDAHYALDLHLLSSGPIDFPVGTHIQVEGVLVPSNQLNSDMWQKYPIDGIIAVTGIQKN